MFKKYLRRLQKCEPPVWTNRDPGSFHLQWDPGINTFKSWKYSLHLSEFSPTLLAAKILAFLLMPPQFSFFQILMWPRFPTHFYTAFLFSLIPSMISFTLMTPKLSKFISLAWFFHKSQKLSVHLLLWHCLWCLIDVFWVPSAPETDSEKGFKY